MRRTVPTSMKSPVGAREGRKLGILHPTIVGWLLLDLRPRVTPERGSMPATTPREVATFRLPGPARAARRAPASRPACPATRAAAPAHGRARPRSPSSDAGAAGARGRTARIAKKGSGQRVHADKSDGRLGQRTAHHSIAEKWAAGWGPPLAAARVTGGSASRGRLSRGTQRWRYRLGRRYGSPALRRTGDPGSANVPRRPSQSPGCDGLLASVCHVVGHHLTPKG